MAFLSQINNIYVLAFSAFPQDRSKPPELWPRKLRTARNTQCIQPFCGRFKTRIKSVLGIHFLKLIPVIHQQSHIGQFTLPAIQFVPVYPDKRYCGFTTSCTYCRKQKRHKQAQDNRTKQKDSLIIQHTAPIDGHGFMFFFRPGTEQRPLFV